jgi:hypothetical protein
MRSASPVPIPDSGPRVRRETAVVAACGPGEQAHAEVGHRDGEQRTEETGEFRDFDVTVMATSIQRAVEGPTFLMGGEPQLDRDAYARELVTLFTPATRA